MFIGYTQFINTVVLMFLPTLIIALTTYPHYSKLNLEQKQTWINEWGTTRIPLGLALVTLLSLVYPFVVFVTVPNAIVVILSITIVAMMFVIYFNWIKMITPPAEGRII